MGMEIELKLALAAKEVPGLKRQALLKAVKPSRSALYSIYFDTPGFDLYRRGVAFRLRRVGYHWVQTVKVAARASGALSSRPEWEVQVTGNQPDLSVLPAEARSHVEDVMDRLAPCFETEFRRTTWLLEQGQGSVEVALDQGEIRAGGEVLPISEIELELKAGEGLLLFDAAETLLAAVPLTLEPRSKAQRGYALAGILKAVPCKAIAPAIDMHLPAAEAWRRMASAALAQFGANVPGFLEGGEDPEYVHQLRVAVRRLRAVLGLGVLAGLEPPEWRDDFKWLMGELSPARDWDVLVTETLPRVRAGLVAPDVLDALTVHAGAARASANARVRQALVSRRLVGAVLAAEADLMAARDGGMDVLAWAQDALDRRYRQFRKAGKGFDRLDAAERHRLRIAAKRLRYAAEGFLPLFGEKGARYVALIARLQDVLGVANDIAVAHGLMTGLVRDRRESQAAGIVEGYLACEARQRNASTAEVAAQALNAKPFWR
jgi:inorganic triphosphatase YgiF